MPQSPRNPPNVLFGSNGSMLLKRLAGPLRVQGLGSCGVREQLTALPAAPLIEEDACVRVVQKAVLPKELIESSVALKTLLMS